MVGFRSDTTLERSSKRLTKACVVAKLPAVIIVIDRSPGTVQVNIFFVVEKLSTPALVRVSDMKTRPRFKRRPTQ